MTNKTNNSLTSVADSLDVGQTTRLDVQQSAYTRRVNPNFATIYSPDGDSKVWWRRLKKALGTKSSDFVNASLFQLQAAAQLPCSGISEPPRTPLSR